MQDTACEEAGVVASVYIDDVATPIGAGAVLRPAECNWANGRLANGRLAEADLATGRGAVATLATGIVAAGHLAVGRSAAGDCAGTEPDR